VSILAAFSGKRKPANSLSAMKQEILDEELAKQYSAAESALSAFQNRQAVQTAGAMGELTGGVLGREVFSSRDGKAANATPAGRAAISKDLFNLQLQTLTDDLGMKPDEILRLMQEVQDQDIMQLQMEREGSDPWGGLIRLQERMRQPRSQDFGKAGRES
jgi:hypothetical protein